MKTYSGTLTLNRPIGVYVDTPRCAHCGYGMNIQHRAERDGQSIFICSLADAKRYARAHNLAIVETDRFPTRNYAADAQMYAADAFDRFGNSRNQ